MPSATASRSSRIPRREPRHPGRGHGGRAPAQWPACAEPSPTASPPPSAEPTAVPTASPSPSAVPTASAAPTPTPEPSLSLEPPEAVDDRVVAVDVATNVAAGRGRNDPGDRDQRRRHAHRRARAALADRPGRGRCSWRRSPRPTNDATGARPSCSPGRNGSSALVTAANRPARHRGLGPAPGRRDPGHPSWPRVARTDRSHSTSRSSPARRCSPSRTARPA